MYIVTEKKSNDKVKDGIDMLINLSEEKFNDFLDMLTISSDETIENWVYIFYSTDKCKRPEIDIKEGVFRQNERNYVGNGFRIEYFMRELKSYMAGLEPNSAQWLRLNRIYSTRDITALKRYFSGNDERDIELIDRLFDVLTDDSMCEKFTNFDEHSEEFYIEGKEVPIQEFLKMFGEIFKYRDETYGDANAFFEGSSFINQFFLPQEIRATIYRNATQIYKTYYERYGRYIDRRYEKYEFREPSNIEDMPSIREGDEPEWNVNEELRISVFKNMPQDLSLEEQALFIYTRLCQELKYNEEYFFQDTNTSAQITNDFSKEHLESIKPGSKVTCFDFSRIFSKIVNKLDGNIEAVVIPQGKNKGHFLTGFYTDRASVRLEAMNIHLNDSPDITNDLMKAKAGIELGGVHAIFDRDGIVEEALKKVYSLTYKKTARTIGDFVQELKSIPQVEVPTDDTNLKLQSLIEVVRAKGIDGNEFVQTLETMLKNNFLSKDVQKAFVGKRNEENGRTHTKRMILFRLKSKKENGESQLFLVDTSPPEMIDTTSQQLLDEFNKGNMFYEDKQYKIPGIDREEVDDKT